MPEGNEIVAMMNGTEDQRAEAAMIEMMSMFYALPLYPGGISTNMVRLLVAIDKGA